MFSREYLNYLQERLEEITQLQKNNQILSMGWEKQKDDIGLAISLLQTEINRLNLIISSDNHRYEELMQSLQQALQNIDEQFLVHKEKHLNSNNELASIQVRMFETSKIINSLKQQLTFNVKALIATEEMLQKQKSFNDFCDFKAADLMTQWDRENRKLSTMHNPISASGAPAAPDSEETLEQPEVPDVIETIERPEKALFKNMSLEPVNEKDFEFFNTQGSKKRKSVNDQDVEFFDHRGPKKS